MNAGVATLSVMALGIAMWLWYHHQAIKTTTLLALFAGLGFATAAGSWFGQGVTWLVGALGSTTAAWIGVTASAVVTGFALIGTLEVILKGIWPRTAYPQRWHPLLALVLPTVVIASGAPVLAAVMRWASSGVTGLSAVLAGGPTTTGAGAVGLSAAAAVACAPVAGLSSAQLATAAAIVGAGRQLDVPPRGQVVAVATAMQESRLANLANPAGPVSLALPHVGGGDDHDSVGVFQQRGSGWGSLEQRMTPGEAAATFYRHLVAVPGWEAMPVTDAAQTVQRSAFPTAYARWEDDATALVTGCHSTPGGSSGGVAGRALAGPGQV